MSDDFTFGTDGSEAAKLVAKQPAATKPANTEPPATDTLDRINPGSQAAVSGSNQEADAARDDMSRILGQIVTLLGQSPAHKHIFLADLEWLVLPAMLNRQVCVWRRQTDRGNMPVAYASWAMVSEEVDARLRQEQVKLKPTDWQSGEIAWLIDMVAPYGGADTAVQELADQVVPGGVMKALVPASGGGMAVRELRGKAS